MNDAERDVDVVIVGAGMSGLAAGDALQQIMSLMKLSDDQKLDYVVLEASERFGGRVLTQEPEQGYLDVGGQYLGASQSYTNTLVERFGIETFRTWLPQDKHSVYQSQAGRLTLFYRDYPLTDDIFSAIAEIEALVLMVKANLSEPWKAPAARYLDSMSVEDWTKETKLYAFGRELMTLAIRAAFSVEPSEISMLYLVHYAATCGSFRAFMNVNGGGDAIRLTRGMHSMAQCLVGEIGEGRVHYNQVVERIVQDEATGRARVYVRGSDVPWSAERVIMAMSPCVSVKNIAYDPPLDPRRVTLAEGAPMASTIKGFLRYERPWWRELFTGYALSAKGPACWVMDNTWKNPDNGDYQFAALMTFISGQPARDWGAKSQDERRAALEEQVQQLFGWRGIKAPKAIAYVEQDWARDTWAGGGPAGCFGPNVLSIYGEVLRAQSGLIHWAGSETATEWMGGYVNGALQAGVRAAGEVADELLFEPRLAQQAQPMQVAQAAARRPAPLGAAAPAAPNARSDQA